MGGSMTALNPLNPQSANASASNQRQRHKRRSNGKHNGSVSSSMAKNNKISPQSKVLGSVVSSIPGSQLSSPSIHIPGLPDVEEQQKHSRRNHRLTSSTLMSSKSTLDDIDDLDGTSDRIKLTNEAKYSSKLYIRLIYYNGIKITFSEYSNMQNSLCEISILVQKYIYKKSILYFPTH